MTSLLFESPLKLLGVAALAALMLAAYARVRGSRRARYGLLVVALLAPVGLLVQQAVVTARERLEEQCRQLARLVEGGDVQGLAVHLADDLDAEGLHRQDFLEAAKRTLSRYHPEEASLGYFDITFPRADEGVAVFEASCRVVSMREVLQRLHTKWRVTFRLESGVWKVTRIEMLPMPTSPIASLHDVLQ